MDLDQDDSYHTYWLAVDNFDNDNKKKIQIFFPVFLMAKMNFLLSHVRKFSSLILMKSRKSALMMEKLF